jgi:hypothetical protein
VDEAEPAYPNVIGEFETVRAIIAGHSIARFGDGELKVMEGRGYVRQPIPPLALSNELLQVSQSPAPGCLLGIPTLDPAGAKYENWIKSRRRLTKYFSASTGLTYYSSFITRPDSAQWLECAEYHALLCQTWLGKGRVTIVSEANSKILSYVRATCPNVVHIECPRHEAYSLIRHFERATVKTKPDIALLSCGVTATCLANRLAARGIQAFDIGSVGGFLWRWA